MQLEVGGKGKLNVLFFPAKSTNKAVTWRSEDASIATVDENGEVTGISQGRTKIVATTKDGNRTAECVLIVGSEVPVSGISFNICSLHGGKLPMEMGQVGRLETTFQPEDATQKDILWKSDNEKVLSVDAKGNLQPLTPGTAVITATTLDGGKTATCEIEVISRVSGISIGLCALNDGRLTMTAGSTETLLATLMPADASNPAVTWTSDDTSVATVDADGLVTALHNGGTTTLTATTEDGEKTAECVVTVVVPPGSVSISGCPTTPLTPGNAVALTATVSPANATNRSVTWSSSSDAIATVNVNGLVTARTQGGTAAITARTVDGGRTATCNVTVRVPVSKVSIGGCSISMLQAGSTRQLTATVSPANATNPAVTWSSSNNAIATVNANGLVTGVSTGETTIVARATDGSNEGGSCWVSISPVFTRIIPDTQSAACMLWRYAYNMPTIIEGQGFRNVTQVLVGRYGARVIDFSSTRIRIQPPCEDRRTDWVHITADGTRFTYGFWLE